jgi:lipoate-protein ligase A
MRVISINNYENLMEVLESEKKNGTRAYIGACCTAFFTKKYKAFVNAELPCAIVDINDTTCYELSEEDLAYKGEFKKQTSLKTGVMKKLLSLKSKTPASLKG